VKYRVEVTGDFWDALKVALPDGSSPSWAQFASTDLEVIFRVFGDGWDDLIRPYGDRDEYRAHVGAGVLGAWHVEARLESGVIRLLSIEVDPWLPPLDGDLDE